MSILCEIWVKKASLHTLTHKQRPPPTGNSKKKQLESFFLPLEVDVSDYCGAHLYARLPGLWHDRSKQCKLHRGKKIMMCCWCLQKDCPKINSRWPIGFMLKCKLMLGVQLNYLYFCWPGFCLKVILLLVVKIFTCFHIPCCTQINLSFKEYLT